jgi:hypothetical protein
MNDEFLLDFLAVEYTHKGLSYKNNTTQNVTT